MKILNLYTPILPHYDATIAINQEGFEALYEALNQIIKYNLTETHLKMYDTNGEEYTLKIILQSDAAIAKRDYRYSGYNQNY